MLGGDTDSLFWSSVDLTGNQTDNRMDYWEGQFWSSVDLTGNQTITDVMHAELGFGAVSI